MKIKCILSHTNISKKNTQIFFSNSTSLVLIVPIMKEALIFNLFPIFLINLFLKRNYSFLYLFLLVDCFFHLPFDHGYISGLVSKYWFNFANFFYSFYLKHQVCVIPPKLCGSLHRMYSKVFTLKFYRQRTIYTHFKVFAEFE